WERKNKNLERINYKDEASIEQGALTFYTIIPLRIAKCSSKDHLSLWYQQDAKGNESTFLLLVNTFDLAYNMFY
ncbi:15607_t:CDS:1, partial [Cetraspora pellucida]